MNEMNEIIYVIDEIDEINNKLKYAIRIKPIIF
jgi:hypothetical protein